MKKIIQKLANKAICAAFVVLGAMSVCAELVKTPILQTFDDVTEPVSVGYKVTGLENGEVAMVYTNHLRTATWTVPANLKNVEFLVVGGGGGGGAGPTSAGYAGCGGGGGGVVFGSITNLPGLSPTLIVEVGEGGSGGLPGKGSPIGVAGSGKKSLIKMGEKDLVVAYGGGGDGGYQSAGQAGGSCSGRRNPDKSSPEPEKGEYAEDYIKAEKKGEKGGVTVNKASTGGAGGGGAEAEGANEGKRKNIDGKTHYYSGNGGLGYTSTITGETKVYGSGGGGGVASSRGEAGEGPEGAGNGGYGDKSVAVEVRNGAPGLANQGGGGGGAAHTATGGNGGSGIVVFRYVEPQTAVAKIGETPYATLEAAFAAATEGQEIDLLQDATPVLKSQSAITKADVIDLGGKTLTLTEDDLYFGTTTFKNGTIVVDPSVKPSTAVFWMFANQTLTFDNVKIVATGVTGTYLIGLEGTNCDLNLLNGSEILVENTTALDLDIICVNGSTDNDIVIDNSKINVTNLDGRVLFRGNYTIKGNSEINLAGITKAGIRIEAGQTLSIEDTAKVTIAGEPRDGGIHLTDVTATYTKADTATVTATINKPYQLSGEGTEASPYLIQNIDDLIFFRDSVNKGETKYSAPGVWVALAADIDMAGENWVGIGSITQDHGFMGNFDGKTFKIKNLTINNPTLNGGYAYAGFFSITEGTETAQNIIKNLTIENVTINTTGQIVSAAIAYPYYTIVENVNVCGDINITGGDYTAGALAYTRRCVNASNVSVVGKAGSTITGGQAVGGVISDIQMNGGLIANYSNFAAENLTITGTKMVGGISGIIATQTLNGATVKDVTINCADRAGQVVGSFGGTSTINNIVVENVTGADAIIGGGYDGSKPVEAKLGDTFYSTFAEAYAAAKAGDTITLLADIAATEVILLDKNLTINGNGHKVTSSATRIFRVTTANTEVTLNDVNMVSTAVRVGTNDIRGISIDNVKGIKLTLNNCSVDFTDASANDWAYAVNVTGGSNHTLTVNGGTYEGANVINVRGENNTVVVKNAMLNSTYPNNDMYYGAGIWVEQEKGSSVEATGNSFNGSNAVAFNLGIGTTLTESNNIDNTTRCVAKIGGQYYTTFAEAYAAAQAGDTITLLADISSSAIIVLDKAITLDGNGKTLTSTAGRAINVSGADGVTIKNLTINAKGERAINIIQNATNVTIENVTATAANYTVNVASSAPNAVVAIKNSTLNGLCTVNVSAAGAQVTVQDSTVNCNDNNTTAGESYAALSLNKEAVGGTIAVTGTTINVAEGSDSVEARNGAENGTITIDGSTAQVNTVVAYITYPNSTAYHAFYTLQSAIEFAKAGETVTLLRDVTLTSKLTLNKAVTIDGNGHSIVADSNTQWYTVSGKLNIKNYSPWIVVKAQGSELKNVVIDCNSCAGGVKIENADAVIFDTVSIIKSKADTLTVTGSLLIENYFKAEGSYSTIDARNGVVTVAEGTIFDMDKFSGNVSPSKCDLKAAVDTNGKPYFCAYGSTTYYRTLTSIAGTITDLTLLDDVSLNKDITVKGTLDLNGKTLTLAEGKVLKTGGNLTIKGDEFVNPILLTNASYTVKARDGLNVITNVPGKKVVYENGVYKLADIVYAAQIGEQKYETLQAALDAAVAGTGSVTVEILSDIDMTGKTWTPVAVDSDSFITVNGNNKTITGLNDMLFASTWAGTSGLVINDLTIANSTIVHDENDSAGNIGVGAFVGYPQASATVTLNNCHLKDSTVKGGHWTGGLVGIAGGYNGSDGPVFMTLTIDGCSVTGSTITGKGSAGGIIGHGSCSAWTDVIIVNSTVSNNTITSTGSSDNKAGSVMGTIGAAGQPTTVNGVTKTGGMSVSVTTAGNTVKSADKVITTIYGRQGTETGLLEIAGGTYESYPIEENVEYAAPKDGYIIFENADGKYGVKEGAYVAQINGVKYETLAAALSAAQDGATVELLWAEGNAPIAMNGSVFGKSVTITGTATVDWSKGFLFVGRGGEGNGTVIFDNANLESASNNASYGIHVSGREKNTNNKYDGTVVINNSTIVLDYLIDKGAMTMTNSTLTVKNGFAVGGRPASETESGVDATATFDLTNGSTLIVNNHNGMGLGYEAIGVMTIDSTSTFECTQSFLVTDKGVLKSAGNVFGDIVKRDNAQIELTGGIYTDEEVPGWCAEPYAALPNLNNQYVVGVKPTATVNSFGATTVPAGNYGVWNGSSYTGTSKVDMPLSFVMQFLADQNEEDMKTSPFADWYGDFVITFTGIENGSFTADGCYLAGHYGDFGWVKVPVDGMIIENDARYPVMLGVGLGQKYDYICSSVEDFKCAMFLTPEIIAANPNLKVKLELAVVDNSKGSDDAANALVNNDKVFSVTEYEYGAEAFAPALPTATVTSIDAPEGTPLTFALNFKADDVTDEQLAYYRDWYADFVLTITGLPEEGVTFNTDGTADGYLAGQYDAWSENWVSVPFEDVTLRNGESIKIMEYAATLMGQSGLKLTYNDVYSFVKNFDCGVYFTPEFLAANPDMKVSLSLRMYKTGDATDEGVAIGEMEEFSAPTVVAKIGSTPYATLEAAIAAAGADDTVTILKNVGTDAAIRVAKKVTIDLNGKTIAATENDKVGDGVFCVVAGGDLTINDSVGTGVINGVGDNDYNIAIWANGGKVTINGGNYTNVGATDKTDPNAHFDLIYAKNGGEVIINGGTFECETPAFTLNSHDTYKGVITVNGGTFVGFDPRNNAAETAGTTFMAVGKYTFAEGGNYIVVTPEDYILNGAASDSATVGDVDSLLAGAVTVTKDGEKYVAIATYTFKVTAVDTVNPEKSSYELTGGKLRPGKTVAVKYIDLATGAESWVKPESDTVTFKLVIK